MAQTLIRDHITGQIELRAPDLLAYEVANAVVTAARPGRIDCRQGEMILTSIDGLNIGLEPVVWQQSLPLARRFGSSSTPHPTWPWRMQKGCPSSPPLGTCTMPSRGIWIGH